MRLRGFACAALAVVAFELAVLAQSRGTAADLQPTVILVSLDGFRWDYPTKAPTPNLRRLMASSR